MSQRCSNCRNELRQGQDVNYCSSCGEPTSAQEIENFERIRCSLLPTYSHQTMTHGGYLIALIIGALTLISRWKDFQQNLGILFLLLGLIVGIGLYVVGRIFFWSFLSSDVVNIRINDLVMNEVTVPLISRCQRKTVSNFVKIKTGYLWKCVSSEATIYQRLLLIGGSTAVVSVILLVLYYSFQRIS